MTSIILIILSGLIKTRSTKAASRMDTFNEVKLIFIMYHIICFTRYIPDPETQFTIGYSCMAFLMLGLLTNMSTLIKQPFILCRLNLFIALAKRRAKK